MLIEHGFSINSVQETDSSTPDFEITNGKEKIVIEVNAKQYTDEESKALDDFHNRVGMPPLKPGVNISEHIVTPFGKPEKDESITENAISRLCAIKGTEKQFSSEYPSILWIDFQDELWTLGLKPDSAFPIRSWNGGYYSGEIWYSLYGKKGDPIFNGETTEHRRKGKLFKMKHDARFISKSLVDAVVYSFLNKLIVLENPFSVKRIPEWFWYKFLSLRDLQYECSMMNWPCGTLASTIENQREMIAKLANQEWYSW